MSTSCFFGGGGGAEKRWDEALHMLYDLHCFFLQSVFYLKSFSFFLNMNGGCLPSYRSVRDKNTVNSITLSGGRKRTPASSSVIKFYLTYHQLRVDGGRQNQHLLLHLLGCHSDKSRLLYYMICWLKRAPF